jgi:two-component system, cell cycle sensor histidine kinase and response regulator CckA
MTLTPNKKTILLVDDEELILEIGKNAMSRWGYDVIPVNSGVNALKIFIKNKDSIDLVVLDMVLGDMHGEEVYVKLKAMKTDVKVLVASGCGMDRRVIKIMGCKENRFIQKPFSIANFRDALEKMLKKG